MSLLKKEEELGFQVVFKLAILISKILILHKGKQISKQILA